MTDPLVLKAPVPRSFVLVMGLSPTLLGVVAVFDHSGARGLLVWTAVALALLGVLFLGWANRRAIVLDDEWLTTRAVRHRRIARARIEAVEPVSTSGGEHVAVVHDGGQRTPLNLVASHADITRIVDQIRQWAGALPSPCAANTASCADEASWSEPVQKDVKVTLGIAGAVVALVPLSLLWHPVPWWGWVACAGLAALMVRPLQQLRPCRVALEGDEIVLRRRATVRARAVDVVRVVTVSRQDKRESLLEVHGQEPLRLPAGERVDERSAAVQAWAEQHGGGLGSPEPFQLPRRWNQLLFTLLVMACAMGSMTAAMTHPGSVVLGMLFPLLMAVWSFFQPTTLVHDWSHDA